MADPPLPLKCGMYFVNGPLVIYFDHFYVINHLFFQDAVDKCNGAKGLMPRATVLATTIEMLSTLSYAQGIWVGLKTKNGQ